MKKITTKTAYIQLQAQLKQLGFYLGRIDGIWGAMSQHALLDCVRIGNHKLGINFEKIKYSLFKGGFIQDQVDGINTITDALNRYGNEALHPAKFSYMFSTTFHESAHTMQPISEYGKGRRRPYGRWFKNRKGIVYGKKNNKGKPYLRKDYPHLYYGRGYPQLTWWDNYRLFGKILKIDLLNKPELAKVPKHSADILIIGSLNGLFTGLGLNRTIKKGSYRELINSRRVINGFDRAKRIADYTVIVMNALEIQEI